MRKSLTVNDLRGFLILFNFNDFLVDTARLLWDYPAGDENLPENSTRPAPLPNSTKKIFSLRSTLEAHQFYSSILYAPICI